MGLLEAHLTGLEERRKSPHPYSIITPTALQIKVPQYPTLLRLLQHLIGQGWGRVSQGLQNRCSLTSCIQASPCRVECLGT